MIILPFLYAKFTVSHRTNFEQWLAIYKSLKRSIARHLPTEIGDKIGGVLSGVKAFDQKKAYLKDALS